MSNGANQKETLEPVAMSGEAGALTNCATHPWNQQLAKKRPQKNGLPLRFINERKYLKNLTSKTVAWYEQSFTSKDCLDKLSKGKSHDFNFSAKPLRRE